MTIDELIDALERLKNTQIGIHGSISVVVRVGDVDYDVSHVYDTQQPQGRRLCVIDAEIGGG